MSDASKSIFVFARASGDVVVGLVADGDSKNIDWFLGAR